MNIRIFLPLVIVSLIALCSCQDSSSSNQDTEEKATVSSEQEVEPRQERELPANDFLNKLGMDTTYALPKGLQVGDVAPDFVGNDHEGNSVQLKEKLKEGPVVLVFYRGFWCGLCNQYLEQFADSLGMVTDKGASVLAVAPEAAEYAKKTVANTGFNVPVVIDIAHQVMDDYGVTFRVTEDYQERVRSGKNLELVTVNDDDQAFLPVPATYIIDEKGVISYAFFEPKYNERAYVKDILAHL